MSMLESTYLTCSLNKTLYGINATNVEEILSLPEITPIPNTPTDIIGILNVRGDIVPIMDLNLRFGYKSTQYSINDTVILLRTDHQRIGIVINEVHEVCNLATDNLESREHWSRDLNLNHKKASNFIQGIAKNDQNLIVILNLEALVNHVEIEDEHLQRVEQQLQEIIHNGDYGQDHNLTPEQFFNTHKIFCPQATEAERAIFKKRAEGLSATTLREDLKGRQALAVIVLNDEFFGIDLNLVREFTDIHQITPVPCCPSHIIGNMNLRGEIVTLVDICGLLNLSIMGIAEGSQAMVVDLEDCVAGIIVEEVSDVIFINSEEITSVPTAIHALNDEYIKGTATYQGKMMSILNLRKIVLDGSLMVEQVV